MEEEEKYINQLEPIAFEVGEEVGNQFLKWGEQNIEVFDAMVHHVTPSEKWAKELCEKGPISYPKIALEEFSEALNADTMVDQRDELVQLAAVVISWIGCIDRKLK